jgi:uroporphyrin-3 C-methyltransferase
MTESKTPLTSEKMSEPTPEVSSTSKATLKQTTQKNDTKAVGAKPANTKQKPPSKSPNKISKLAIVAIIIAIAAPAGHYYWQQLQHQTLVQSLTQKIKDENSATLSRYKTQMQQALSNQEQVLSNKLQQISAQIQQTSQGKITALENTVAKLEQGIKNRQPSDWLLHEAEYLIRISARTLWLEHDSRAAIGLLKDADARLTELNDPAFLPVRETIHQDINTLTLMPTLETDDVIVTLIAMNKQVTDLSLAIIDLGKENTATDIALSDNINDWQSNLAKTWQKFLNDFIRVRQRVGTVEALISPEQQANLKQNLNLKIQLAIWAATERKGELYQKTLTDIQQWLNEFFDMEDNANQLFYNALTALQNKQVAYDYPSELSSLTAIRATLRNQQIQPLQSIQENDNTPEEKATDATNDATQDPKSEGNL